MTAREAVRHLRSPSLTTISAVVTSGVVGGTLLAHAWLALPTAWYVNNVTGVWLALAQDLAHGLFYRDLIGPAGYGGTRYLPVFFGAIAALIRLGVSPLAAGFVASIAGGALLAAAVERVLARLGLRPALRVAFAALTLAAPLVQQTLLSIRCDLLAAGLAMLGLAGTLPHEETGRSGPHAGPDSTKRPAGALGGAALLLILAVATKLTSVYVLAAAVLALAFARRGQAARRLVLWLGAWGLSALVLVQFASEGRALASFRACALGGTTALAWLSGITHGLVTEFAGGSHFLTAVLSVGVVAWLADARRHWRSPSSILLVSAIGMTAVILASPGTIPTNHTVDVYMAAIIAVGVWVARHPRWAPAAGLLALALALSSVRPNLEIVRNPVRHRLAVDLAAGRERTIWVVDHFRQPVLSESPELQVMAGRPASLVDPFALRVVMRQRPDIERDLIGRLDAHRFAYVILVADPLTPAGRGWYTNIDFGWPVTECILANYQLQEVDAGFRIYRPRAGDQGLQYH